MQASLMTGSMPGMAASTRETWLLGSPPNSVEAPENSFALEATWACTSMPTTTSQSPMAPLISKLLLRMLGFCIPCVLCAHAPWPAPLGTALGRAWNRPRSSRRSAGPARCFRPISPVAPTPARACARDKMKIRTLVLMGALALGLAGAPASAKTFRYAFQGDLNALDPYTLNESFTLGALGNVMEGLSKRGKDLKIIGGRPESWEPVDSLRWRLPLRKGVNFHNGEDFTADDVVFSTERMRGPSSQLQTRAPRDMKAVKVDDYTVDFVLTSPNPILHAEWDTWYMMSKKW